MHQGGSRSGEAEAGVAPIGYYNEPGHRGMAEEDEYHANIDSTVRQKRPQRL